MPALTGYNSVAASVFLMRKRSIKLVLPHFYLTWSSRTRNTKVQGPGVEAKQEQ